MILLLAPFFPMLLLPFYLVSTAFAEMPVSLVIFMIVSIFLLTILDTDKTRNRHEIYCTFNKNGYKVSIPKAQ